MLKRLLTAVLVLCLIMAFTSTAFSGNYRPGDDPKADISAKRPATPNPALVPKFAKSVPSPMETAQTLATPVANRAAQTPSSPDTVACYLQDYYDNNTTGASVYTRRSCHPGSRAFAMRMDGAAQPSHLTKIFGAIPWIYRCQDGDLVTGDGQVGVTIGIWSDAGGVPGTLIYEQTFMVPNMASPGDYVPMYFTNPVIISDPVYHVTFGPDLSGPCTDSVTFYSDNAGTSGSTAAATNRGSVYADLTNTGSTFSWYPALGYFSGGLNPNWDIYTDQCEVYSSCTYVYSPFSGPGYIGLYVDIPSTWFSSDGSTLNHVAQRMTALEPDTLEQLRLRWYLDGTLYTSASTNGLTVNIYGDDGTGLPDISNLIISKHFGPTDLVPTWPTADGWQNLYIDYSADNIVLRGNYQVELQMDSDNPADGVIEPALWYEYGTDMSVFTDGSGMSVQYTGGTGSQDWQNTGVSANWLSDGWGTENGMYVRALVCKDEFADCQTGVTYDAPASTYLLRQVEWAQMIKGKDVNRVEKIRLQTDWWTGDPDIFVSLYTDNGGQPGTRVFDTVLTGASKVWYPGWTEVVIPNGGVQIVGNFWVSYANATPVPGPDSLGQLGEHGDVGHTIINGGIWRNLAYDPTDFNAAPNWQSAVVTIGYDYNLLIQADFCSTVPIRRICTPGDDWPTVGHDYARTGASFNAISDAYCDLTLNWIFTDPTQYATYTGPIVSGGYIVCAFSTHYQVLDMTGALVATLDNPAWFGADIRCIPTVATIDVGGNPTPVLFVAGGSMNSIAAYHFPPANGDDTLWTIRPPTWRGFGNIGVSRFNAFIVLNQGGTDVLYFGTDAGKVFAVEAATGNAYTPWGVGSANATLLGGSVQKSGATDGTHLYFATKITGLNGDIFALDPANGDVVWQLSTSGGLKGATIYSAAGNAGGEGFDAGVAVDANDGVLYANSTMDLGDHPTDGVFYRINAATGAVLSAVASNADYGSYSSPIIDKSLVYMPSRSRWVTPPSGGDILAFSKLTGFNAWAVVLGPDGNAGSPITDCALSCEDGPGQLLVFTERGYFVSVNTNNGSEIFNRRINRSPAAGGSIAIVPDHVITSDYFGDVIDLTKQADRPRMEIVHYTGSLPVPFGSPNPVSITYPKMITNEGCAPLTIDSIVMDDVSNGVVAGSYGIRNRLLNSSSNIADMLTQDSKNITKGVMLATDLEKTIGPRESINKTLLNPAAAATPPYLNTRVYGPFTLNPGDTIDITVDVNGPMVSRGPNPYFATVWSDDPDFFLANTGNLVPQIALQLVGGCLMDTTYLHFGASDANYQKVSNCGRLGTGDWVSGSDEGNFFIDGANANFYQGTYIYAVDSHRIAMNTEAWYGQGAAYAWISMQGDPNFCDHSCKPALETGVTIASASTDGITYTDLVGNVVCKSYIDSVINYGISGTWNWVNFAAPFDNSLTMGLKVDSKTFGITDAPLAFDYLNQATVEVMTFTERNGNALPNWRFGAVVDYDIAGATDTACYDGSISAAWDTDKGGKASATVMGMIKLPFGGCGYAPIVNTRSLNGDQALYFSASPGPKYWDSAYYYMGLPAGATGQAWTSTDRECHFSIAKHDFAPNESYKFAVANFQFTDMADPYHGTNIAPLARTLNQLVGFGRGDVNNDGTINLLDIMYLNEHVNAGGPGSIPFAHLADVNGDGNIDNADVTYLINYYFNYGPCPVGQWTM